MAMVRVQWLPRAGRSGTTTVGPPRRGAWPDRSRNARPVPSRRRRADRRGRRARAGARGPPRPAPRRPPGRPGCRRAARSRDPRAAPRPGACRGGRALMKRGYPRSRAKSSIAKPEGSRIVERSADGAGWGRNPTQPASASAAPHARRARRNQPRGTSGDAFDTPSSITCFSFETLPERAVLRHLRPVHRCRSTLRRSCYNADP